MTYDISLYANELFLVNPITHCEIQTFDFDNMLPDMEKKLPEKNIIIRLEVGSKAQKPIFIVSY